MTTMTLPRRAWRRVPLALVCGAIAACVVGRLLLGFGVSWVASDSMSPAFHRGDLVLTRLVDAAALQVGDVPVIVPPGESASYVHRIVALDTSAGAPVLRTRGDANGADDAWSARLTTPQAPLVIGVAPGLGRLALLAQEPRSRALLVALIGLLVTALAVREVLLPPKTVPPARLTTPVPEGSS